MNRSVSIGLTILLSCMVSDARSQVVERIESGDSELVLTLWEAAAASSPSVVLVPGWGGGPQDVLGLAEFLSAKGLTTVVVTPRGWHDSGGRSTFAHALDDIGNAVAWTRSRYGTEPVLGGHSWGGGMSIAYAARDAAISRVFSIAGTDHGQFIRQYQSDPSFAMMVDQILAASAAPDGPIRFDVEFGLREMAEGQEVYGLIENAGKFGDRSVLLMGGWDDGNVTVDDTLLPLYRALTVSGVEDVTFHTYHDDHAFEVVRADLHRDLLGWLLK